jgi:hypothetical protein
LHRYYWPNKWEIALEIASWFANLSPSCCFSRVELYVPCLMAFSMLPRGWFISTIVTCFFLCYVNQKIKTWHGFYIFRLTSLFQRKLTNRAPKFNWYLALMQLSTRRTASSFSDKVRAHFQQRFFCRSLNFQKAHSSPWTIWHVVSFLSLLPCGCLLVFSAPGNNMVYNIAWF